MSRDYLVKKRLQKGHSRPQAALEAGLSIGTIKRLEKTNEPPSVVTLIKAIRYYGLTLDDVQQLFLHQEEKQEEKNAS